MPKLFGYTEWHPRKPPVPGQPTPERVLLNECAEMLAPIVENWIETGKPKGIAVVFNEAYVHQLEKLLHKIRP